jgi:MYXO-CTERM domain-containing protein
MLSAVVTADVDQRPANNQESVQLTVDPAVDLVVQSLTGSSSVKLDKSATVTATLRNSAAIDATGVTLTIDLGSSLRADSVSWPLGTCTVTAQRATCQAATFAAGASTTASVSATAISEGSPRITFSLASAEADLVPGDNSDQRRVEVKDPDESGGSTGPLFLAVLAGLILARGSRRRTA